MLPQPFVKDDKVTVGQYVESTAKELDGKLAVVKFERFEKGEGIEKKEACDFASEIASMVK